MPVFDATRNQVLFSPVSNYYQGKAIRQQLAAGEQDQELKGLQIDLAKQEIADAPSKREAAKKYAELQAENIRSQIDERIRDGEVQELEVNAKLLTPALIDYSNEPDEDKALANFNEAIKAILPSMSEESQKKYAEAAGPDHVFSHEEVMLSGLGVRSFMDRAKEMGEPTAKMKEAASLGYEPGSQEYKNYLTESRAKPSVNDVVVPLLTKMAAGEEITEDEQAVLDIYTRASLEERLLAAAFGGDIADLSTLSDGRTVDEGGENAKADAVPVTQVVSKDQVITSLIAEFANVPAGKDREEKLDRYLKLTKELTGVDLSKEEAQIIIDNWAGANIYPNASSGTFER